MKSEDERKREKQAQEPAARPATTTEPEKGTRLSAVEIHDNILAGAAEDMSRPERSEGSPERVLSRALYGSDVRRSCASLRMT